MDDYISREQAIEALGEEPEVWTESEGELATRFQWRCDKNIIETLPAADVVEIIRCKDCRWGREACGNIECFVDSNIPPEYHGYEWFCPNGERRDNDE